MKSPPRVRPIEKSDVPALVDMLTRAFAEDPLCTWFVRDDAKRAKGFRALFHSSIEVLTRPHGETYTTDDLSGAALWTPPGKWGFSLWTQLRSTPGFIASTGWGRALKVLKGVNLMQAHHPKEPNYYLYTLGVEPSRQGEGIGSALIRHVLAKADRENLPAYVETSNPRNLPLYQSHGFAITGELEFPENGPKLWLLWRHPGAGPLPAPSHEG